MNEGLGWVRSTDCSTKPFKTKGSWAYAQRTLSYDNPMDPPTIEVSSLAVLVDEQVAAHISEEEILKLAPLHANLICGTGI